MWKPCVNVVVEKEFSFGKCFKNWMVLEKFGKNFGCSLRFKIGLENVLCCFYWLKILRMNEINGLGFKKILKGCFRKRKVLEIF